MWPAVGAPPLSKRGPGARGHPRGCATALASQTETPPRLVWPGDSWLSPRPQPADTISRAPAQPPYAPVRGAGCPEAAGPHCARLARGHGPSDTIPRSRGPAVQHPYPQPPPTLAQAGGGALVGPGGVTASAAPRFVRVPRPLAARVPAPRAHARTPHRPRPAGPRLPSG